MSLTTTTLSACDVFPASSSASKTIVYSPGISLLYPPKSETLSTTSSSFVVSSRTLIPCSRSISSPFKCSSAGKTPLIAPTNAGGIVSALLHFATKVKSPSITLVTKSNLSSPSNQPSKLCPANCGAGVGSGIFDPSSNSTDSTVVPPFESKVTVYISFLSSTQATKKTSAKTNRNAE